MTYLSVCSGIEAASCAWHPLGWEPAGFSEIEPFPCAVLAHRFPNVKNYGDMTKYKEWENVGKLDLLVGGTPCQSFSVAGLRKGLADPRGNLMLTFGAIAAHFKPSWIVWENVPGVLSSNGGRDFAAFLGMLAELGYGFAYRVLDAQYYGVPQRRRRVFLVGHLGDWRPAAAVLFDAASLCGNPAPSRKTGEGIARGIEIGPSGGSFTDVNPTLDTRCKDGPIRNQLAGAVMCFEPRSPDGHARLIGDISPTLNRMGGGQREPCICLMDQGGGVMNIEYDKTGTLRWETKGHEPIVMATGQGNAEITEDHAPTLNCNHEAPVVATTAVRRLTPTECERLQGFPDNWTRIPWRGKTAEVCPDGPRYKALGNSMAVPVMLWIGERILETQEAQQ
jgi:DNA (cytosine-5)-methyltransferase 1